MTIEKTGRKKISAIVACYNDEPAIPIMAERLESVLRAIEVDYEVIFVNDGSLDGSQELLERLAAGSRRIRVITHSRNFGGHNAFVSGLRRATGDACVLLDGDLQDPPELIAEFHRKWREGYDVVYGIRAKREMPWLRELGYKAFYRLFQKLAYVTVPLDSGSFSLLDRRVVDVFKDLPESDRFIQGLRAWVGFRQAGVEYVRPKRVFGRSTSGFWSHLRWARTGILSFSHVPLEILWFAAGIVSLAASFAVVLALIHPTPRTGAGGGVGPVLAVCLGLGAIQLVGLAMVADYVRRIFEEVKGRPLYIVAKEIGFDA